MSISRRGVLKGAAAVPAALIAGTGLQALMSAAAPATASAAPLGVLLDYAAGVISASDIRGSGALGA
ncbi:MAG: twin-arginine translocation signal domain-containing protein, partial [Mycobacterium sp.]